MNNTTAKSPELTRGLERLRGVNLGGWLVLEKWMTPEVFSGTAAADEYSLCRELGTKKITLLQKHRDSFITEADFAWIHGHGYNAIRLPIGYWALRDDAPYVSTKKYIDFASAMCKKYKLKIILQLHAAPGSQNGEIHSGRRGKVGWHLHKAHIRKTVATLRALAERYGHNDCLVGIGLLNEPSRHISKSVLRTFYSTCYAALQPLINDKVMLIIDSRFRPIRSLAGPQPSGNFVYDTHYYHNQDPRDVARGVWWHRLKLFGRTVTIAAVGSKRLLVGEYTFRLPDRLDHRAGFINQLQERAYARSVGSFYWNYKTSTDDAWSLRSSGN